MTLVNWEDALSVLATLAATTDRTLRDGVLHIGANRADHLGLGLDPGASHDAIMALSDAGYVAWEHREQASQSVSFSGVRVTGTGMQALGQWPLLHTITTPASLAHLLDELADYAADELKAGTLRRAADHARKWAGPALRQSVVSLSAAALRQQIGLAP